MKRLRSATQIAVLEFMHQGWKLNSTQEHCWLSRVVDERLESKTIRSSTVFALKNKGHIEVDQARYPFTTWKLVDLQGGKRDDSD